MRYVLLCATLVTVAMGGCGGGSGGGGKTTPSTSAWQLDEPEYTPGDVTSLAITPDGRTAYLTNGASLLTFDVETRQLQSHSHPTDRFAMIAAVNDDASELYLVPNNVAFPPGNRSLVSFAPATGAQAPLASVFGFGPAAYANGFVYVANFSLPTVDVISATTGQHSAINLADSGGSATQTIARTPAGRSILIGDANTAAFHVIDAVSRRVLYSIPIGIAANRILPIDEVHTIVLGPDSFEMIDITDPSAVPDVHPYPFGDELESDAPALLVDDARRLLIARHAPVDTGSNGGDQSLVQAELVVIDVATGAVRDRTRLLDQEPFDYTTVSYQLTPTADPSAFIFVYEDAIYVLQRTAPF